MSNLGEGGKGNGDKGGALGERELGSVTSVEGEYGPYCGSIAVEWRGEEGLGALGGRKGGDDRNWCK